MQVALISALNRYRLGASQFGLNNRRKRRIRPVGRESGQRAQQSSARQVLRGVPLESGEPTLVVVYFVGLNAHCPTLVFVGFADGVENLILF